MAMQRPTLLVAAALAAAAAPPEARYGASFVFRDDARAAQHSWAARRLASTRPSTRVPPPRRDDGAPTTPFGAHSVRFGDSAPFIEFGHGRFTVYAEDLVRVQWMPDSSGNWTPAADLPSLTISARFAVGAFSSTNSTNGSTLTISTFDYYGNSVLNLSYTDTAAAPPGPESLTIAAALMQWPGTPPPRLYTWVPGASQTENLNGTYTSLDCYTSPSECVDMYWEENMRPGLLSRDGWTFIDDSGTERILPPAPSDPLQWAWPGGAPPNASGEVDWYLHAYGDNFRQALEEIASLSGPTPVPPRAVLGPWWSRYWPYTSETIVSEGVCRVPSLPPSVCLVPPCLSRGTLNPFSSLSIPLHHHP
jgi:hypothetical protein